MFDADGTLFDFERAEGMALEQAFGLIGVTFDPGYLTTYQRINQALWQAVERGEITPGVVKIKRFELLLQAIGVGSLALRGRIETAYAVLRLRSRQYIAYRRKPTMNTVLGTSANAPV